MREKLEVLLIEDNREAADLVQRMLAPVESATTTIRVEWVDTLAKALARLAETTFDAILLDLNLPDSRGIETFSKLRAHRGDVALIVLTASEDEELAFAALREGADEYLVKGDVSGPALARRLRYAVERRQAKAQERSTSTRPIVVGFIGVKGGTGTTTVALNVAAAMAKQNRSTIAVELKPDYGTFSFQLKHTPGTNLSSLCALGAAGIDAAGVASRLCNFPLGLRVLFGPQAPEEFGEIDPRAAEALIKTVSKMAERVVIDLPSAAMPMTQVVARQCDFVLIVLERDPVSVHAAKIVLRLLRAWGITQLVSGAIVVNRVTTYTPMPMEEIATEIDCAILAVIPPAVELCTRANQAGSPVVFFQPESTLAGVLTDVASRFSGEPSSLASGRPAG
jgi:Flp pilus assembly CpaE family ATPase